MGGPGAMGGLMSGLSMASTGLGVLGNVFQGVMSLTSGLQQQKQEQAAATQAKQLGGVNANVALLQGDETAARGATQAAANGGTIGGTSLGVIQQASNAAMFNARTAAYRGLSQANADIYQGEVDRDNGINGLLGGLVGAAGTGVSGAANLGFRQGILSSAAGRSGLIDPMAAMYLLQ